MRASVSRILFALALCAGARAQSPAAAGAGWPPVVPYPDWCRPQQASVAPGRGWQLWGDGRTGVRAMRVAAGRIRHAVERDLVPADERPLYLYQFARIFADLGEDDAALDVSRHVLALPASTPFRHQQTGFAGLAGLQQQTRMVAARVLARNQRRDDVRALLAGQKPATLGEHLRWAELYALLGEGPAAESHLRLLRDAVRPERSPSDILVCLRAAQLARAIGLDAAARTFAEAVVRRDAATQRDAPAAAGRAMLEQLLGHLQDGPLPKRWRDGTHSGQAAGYLGPVEVNVRVAAGRIAAVEVTRQKDDRPWSAFEEVPRRIVERQSLAVDGVTGATVSSAAVLAATDAALRGAAAR